jgi:MFS family permease
LGYNEAEIGLALTAYALTLAISLPIIGSFSDRVGRILPIVTGFSINVVAFAFLPNIQSPITLIVTMAILGFCAVLVFPISQAVVMESLPLSDRGSASGVWGMMMSLGGTIGMFIIAFIVSIAPIEWIFYFGSLSSLVVGIVMIAIRGNFKSNS